MKKAKKLRICLQRDSPLYIGNIVRRSGGQIKERSICMADITISAALEDKP